MSDPAFTKEIFHQVVNVTFLPSCSFPIIADTTTPLQDKELAVEEVRSVQRQEPQDMAALLPTLISVFLSFRAEQYHSNSVKPVINTNRAKTPNQATKNHNL